VLKFVTIFDDSLSRNCPTTAAYPSII